MNDDAITALLAAAKRQKSRQVKSAASILAKQLKLRDQIPERRKLLSEIIEITMKWLEREMAEAKKPKGAAYGGQERKMAGNIEWAGHVWNPVAGCTVLTPGCTNCYAMKMAARLAAMGKPLYAGLTKPSKAGPVWTGVLREAPEHVLLAPLKRKKPTTYFVNSMSDLFHEGVSDATIDKVFAVMALCPQHTFQVLTKRAERMWEYMIVEDRRYQIELAMYELGGDHDARTIPDADWPLRNVWLGVSCEDQRRADDRIPHLLNTPAAVRFVSAEPLLGPITFKQDQEEGFTVDWLRGCSGTDPAIPGLDWIIVGGESGPGARPFHLEWADFIIGQCRADGVACFVKQLGSVPLSDGYPYGLMDRKGGDPDEWPMRLGVREFPNAAQAVEAR